MRAAARAARESGVRVRELQPEELTDEMRRKLQHEVSGETASLPVACGSPVMAQGGGGGELGGLDWTCAGAALSGTDRLGSSHCCFTPQHC